MQTIHQLQESRRRQQQQEQHRLAQGQLTAAEAASRLGQEQGLPLATLPLTDETVTTLGLALTDGGHMLVVAPDDTAWQAQVTAVLGDWPGAALVVDPDGTLYRGTGSRRNKNRGKVYALPGYRFNLHYLSRYWNEDIAQRLHGYLLGRPGPGEWPAWERSVALMRAIGTYGHTQKMKHSLRLLLDVARDSLLQVLVALEDDTTGWHYVRMFTNGLAPKEAVGDPLVAASYQLFGQRLEPYYRFYHDFAVQTDRDVIPADWSAKRGAVYLTYPSRLWPNVCGIGAALVDDVVTYHCEQGDYKPLLLILDAAVAQRLPDLPWLLAKAADYGIRILLRVTSLAALYAVAGDGDGTSLPGQFAHQLWYPPQDELTATHMAWLHGTMLVPDESTPNSLSEQLVLSPAEVQAWPRDKVLLVTRRERPYRCLAQRYRLPTDWPKLAPPAPPQVIPPPQTWGEWLPTYITAIMPDDSDTQLGLAPRTPTELPAPEEVKTDKSGLPPAKVAVKKRPLPAKENDDEEILK